MKKRNIAFPDGTVTPGHKIGPFAVLSQDSVYSWRVVHIPTGLGTAEFFFYREAVEFTKWVLGYIDYNFYTHTKEDEPQIRPFLPKLCEYAEHFNGHVCGHATSYGKHILPNDERLPL